MKILARRLEIRKISFSYFSVLNHLPRRSDSINIKNVMFPDRFFGIRIYERSQNFVICEIAVSLSHTFGVSVDETPAKASIQGSLVQNQSVLNIVSAVRHDCDSRVLSGRKFVKTDQVDGF